MTRSTWRAVLGALLIAACGAGAARPAGAQGPLAIWTKELGVAGGVSFSHGSHGRQDVHDVTGYQLLGRLGLVASDEVGPGWLRGNLELLLEPTVMRLDGEPSAATVGGVAGLVRWVFAGNARVRPYVEAGAGILVGETEFRQTACDVNYLLEAGPGFLVFVSPRVALDAGYRFQHISNASQCDRNLGLNSSQFHVGVSYFLP